MVAAAGRPRARRACCLPRSARGAPPQRGASCRVPHQAGARRAGAAWRWWWTAGLRLRAVRRWPIFSRPETHVGRPRPVRVEHRAAAPAVGAGATLAKPERPPPRPNGPPRASRAGSMVFKASSRALASVFSDLGKSRADFEHAAVAQDDDEGLRVGGVLLPDIPFDVQGWSRSSAWETSMAMVWAKRSGG